MWNRLLVAGFAAFLLIPARAWADHESDCQKGMAMLKSELKNTHPKQVRDRLQKDAQARAEGR